MCETCWARPWEFLGLADCFFMRVHEFRYSTYSDLWSLSASIRLYSRADERKLVWLIDAAVTVEGLTLTLILRARRGAEKCSVVLRSNLGFLCTPGTLSVGALLIT
jgi:hypothetical protein